MGRGASCNKGHDLWGTIVVALGLYPSGDEEDKHVVMFEVPRTTLIQMSIMLYYGAMEQIDVMVACFVNTTRLSTTTSYFIITMYI